MAAAVRDARFKSEQKMWDTGSCLRESPRALACAMPWTVSLAQTESALESNRGGSVLGVCRPGVDLPDIVDCLAMANKQNSKGHVSIRPAHQHFLALGWGREEKSWPINKYLRGLFTVHTICKVVALCKSPGAERHHGIYVSTQTAQPVTACAVVSSKA